jgi:hypothetical protein
MTADLYYSQLSTPQRRAYNATLRSSHVAFTAVELWYPNRDLVGRVGYLLDGQVDLEGITRTATCSFGDPDDNWKLSTNLVFLDRILRVERWVLVPEIGADGTFVRVPIFTGPVVKADENGGTVTLEAQGMELWLKGDIKGVHRWPRGAPVTQVIRQMMLLGGEDLAHLDIPTMNHRLPAAMQIGPQYEGGIWAAVQYLAETIDCDLFYDGAGHCRLRRRPTQVAWEFKAGDEGTLIGQPQRSTLIGGTNGGDATAIVNDVIIFGKAKPQKPPEGGGKPPKPPIIRGEAIAKDGSRFAPNSLGHPGAPLYLKEVATMEHIRLDRTAQQVANERLRRHMQVAAQYMVNTAPIPHLNSFDRIKFPTGAGYYIKASIPFNFTESTPHTIGYNRLVHVPAQRHRK